MTVCTCSFVTVQSHIIAKRLKTRGCNKSWWLVKCAIYVKQNSLKFTAYFFTYWKLNIWVKVELPLAAILATSLKTYQNPFLAIQSLSKPSSRMTTCPCVWSLWEHKDITTKDSFLQQLKEILNGYENKTSLSPVWSPYKRIGWSSKSSWTKIRWRGKKRIVTNEKWQIGRYFPYWWIYLGLLVS